MAAESFVFQTAGQILGKLTTLAFREIGLIWGVKKDFKRLKSTVSAIKAVLLDAAEQKKKSRQVEDWLEKLQDVLYDIDDVLDDFMTEDLRRKVVIKGSKRKAVKNFFSSSNSLALRITMSRKLKKIRSRLEDIDADRKQFGLVERAPDSPFAYPLREQAHSFVHAPDVVGRDLDKSRIIELLLSDSSSSASSSTIENISVLPIVGLGGLGKTTLANLVYIDDAITSNFEIRLWICVSEEFDLKMLIEKIIKDATGKADHAHLDLNQLQATLRSFLVFKKFLLILDDVWNEERKKWTELKDLLNCGSSGSKIVVTTRKRTTAEIMGTMEPYELNGLLNDECMSIFIKCAFKDGEEKQYPKLLKIGKEIVMKCGGLPLAVKSVGSLLYTKREEREWRYIKDNDIWKIKQKENDVLPILKLSYDDLPLNLRKCFAYCATFPKNMEMPRLYADLYLINQWKAHGFIEWSDDSQQLEDIGNQYFQELLSRSFFQYDYMSFDNALIKFKMHDLVHDLALSVAGKLVSHVKYDTRNIYEGTRYLLFCERRLEGNEFPHFLLKLKKVRSFSFQYNVGPIRKTFLDTLIKTFKCLRTLDLSRSKFEELPTSIGTLKHLRCLLIIGNKSIKTLPNTICNLVNLQTLNLNGCVMLQDLPRDFGNLSCLRTLTLTSKMTSFPEKGHAEGLRSLQFLLILGCNNLESLSGQMENLTTLRLLRIFGCPSLTSLPAKSMRSLTSLETLSIANCKNLNLLEEEDTLMELPICLLSLTLRRIPKLRELPRGFENAAATINYIGIHDCPIENLPEWLVKCTSLSRFILSNCMLLESLPLGMHQLTALRYLYIMNCSENLRRKCERETGEYWPSISHILEIYLE
ncbi:hypothetical protein LguiA_026393 [Lonicera macranthoides]